MSIRGASGKQAVKPTKTTRRQHGAFFDIILRWTRKGGWGPGHRRCWSIVPTFTALAWKNGSKVAILALFDPRSTVVLSLKIATAVRHFATRPGAAEQRRAVAQNEVAVDRMR